MPDRKRLISICVPVFNEEQNIEPLYNALLPVMEQVSDKYYFEILFTDNHSTDLTYRVLEQFGAPRPSRTGNSLRTEFRFSTLRIYGLPQCPG